MRHCFLVVLGAVCILSGCAAFRDALNASPQEFGAAINDVTAATAPLDIPAPAKAGAAVVGAYLLVVARRAWNKFLASRGQAIADAAPEIAEAAIDIAASVTDTNDKRPG